MDVRRRVRVVLVAAAVVATAGTGAYLLSDHGEPAGTLLTQARPPSGDSNRAGGAAPSSIAFADPGGSEPEILTHEFWSAWSPAVSFDGRRFVFAGRRDASDHSRIWEMHIRGGGVREITAGNGDPSDPAYLPDGRILFSDIVTKGERLARERGGEKGGAGGPGGGLARAMFSCVRDGTDLRRLTFGDQIDTKPVVLPDGRIRFERGFRDTDSTMLMTIHPDGTGVARYLGGAAMKASTGAITFEPRRVPPILTSVVNPAKRTGTLLCLDAYASRLPGIASLPRGAIAKVRVSRAEAAAQDEVLGEAPIRSDGSFLIEVPADTSVRLTLIGADGRALAAHTSGVWVRPNENRGCVGCHEPPYLVPENRQPLAVREAAVPVTGRATETVARMGSTP